MFNSHERAICKVEFSNAIAKDFLPNADVKEIYKWIEIDYVNIQTEKYNDGKDVKAHLNVSYKEEKFLATLFRDIMTTSDVFVMKHLRNDMYIMKNELDDSYVYAYSQHLDEIDTISDYWTETFYTIDPDNLNEYKRVTDYQEIRKAATKILMNIEVNDILESWVEGIEDKKKLIDEKAKISLIIKQLIDYSQLGLNQFEVNENISSHIFKFLKDIHVTNGMFLLYNGKMKSVHDESIKYFGEDDLTQFFDTMKVKILYGSLFDNVVLRDTERNSQDKRFNEILAKYNVYLNEVEQGKLELVDLL